MSRFKYSYIVTNKDGSTTDIRSNEAPTTNIKTFTMESDGFYTIQLDYLDASIKLSKCIEIFPMVDNKPFVISVSEEQKNKSNELAKKLFREYSESKKTPSTKDAAFILYVTYISKTKDAYIFKTSNNRYFMSLQFIKTQQDADLAKVALMYSYVTMNDLELQFKEALQQNQSVNTFGDYIKPYFENLKNNSRIKVSPYDSTDPSLKLFGNFFNGTTTNINGSVYTGMKTTTGSGSSSAPSAPSDSEGSSNNNNTVIIVVILIILLICIGAFVYFKNQKKSSQINKIE